MKMVLSAVAVLFLAMLVGGCREAKVQGPGGKEMTLAAPRSVTIHRGETMAVVAKIERVKFTGPVTVSISQLSKGVEAVDASQKVETDAATFVLKAAKDAELVSKQPVKIMAEGPEGMSLTEEISLTVKE